MVQDSIAGLAAENKVWGYDIEADLMGQASSHCFHLTFEDIHVLYC